MTTDAPLAEGVYSFDMRCPRCDALVPTVLALGSVLTVPSDDVGSLRVKAKALKVPHLCGGGAAQLLLWAARSDDDRS